MYLLATSLSVIHASLDYAFTIRNDFTSATAGLASLASYVQLTKPMFFCLFVCFFFFNYFSPKVCPPILGYFHYSLYMTLILPYHYPWSKLSGGLLPTTSLEFEFYWAVRFPPISANVNKHWKTRVKGNDDITNVISANKYFASTFSIQMFKFQRRSCNWVFPPFPAPLPQRPGELARRLTHHILV